MHQRAEEYNPKTRPTPKCKSPQKPKTYSSQSTAVLEVLCQLRVEVQRTDAISHHERCQRAPPSFHIASAERRHLTLDGFKNINILVKSGFGGQWMHTRCRCTNQNQLTELRAQPSCKGRIARYGFSKKFWFNSMIASFSVPGKSLFVLNLSAGARRIETHEQD